MTKKGKDDSSQFADFFSDIAEDLKSQVKKLHTPPPSTKSISSEDSSSAAASSKKSKEGGDLFDKADDSSSSTLYQSEPIPSANDKSQDATIASASMVQEGPPAPSSEEPSLSPNSKSPSTNAEDTKTMQSKPKNEGADASKETEASQEEKLASQEDLSTPQEETPQENKSDSSANDSESSQAASEVEKGDAEKGDAEKGKEDRDKAPIQTVKCPQCGHDSKDPIWCESCGTPLKGPDARKFKGSEPQTEAQIGPHKYLLEQAIFQSSDRVVWRARRLEEEEGKEATLFLVEEISVGRYQSGYQRMPELDGARILRPDLTQVEEDRVFLSFRKPSGHRLKEKLEDLQHRWKLDDLRHIIQTIGYTLASIHEAKRIFLQLDARHIWMEDNEDPLLLSVERLYSETTPFRMRPVREGFSAPEIFQRNAKLGPTADIFSLGILLHYMISHAPLFNHLDSPFPEIPSPRSYSLDFPIGLAHVIRKACHPDPNQRYQRVSQFLGAFERALREIEQRSDTPHKIHQLSVGHDIHIGVNKGTRNPVNQDALFWRFDRTRGKGLFVIADGVSHCNYGSGDRASSLLIQSARKCWDSLVQKPMMHGRIDGAQRRQILASITEAANIAIGKEINAKFDRIEGYVEDVMGSTFVAGFLDGNQITLANLGDSRAYIKTDDFIEQITVDHDYKTAQMQAHMDMRSLSTLMGANLITRCVGSFQKDEKLKLIPRKLDIDFFDITLLPGDTLLLCSDGLSDYAGSNEEEARQSIVQLLNAYPEPLSACFWLVALANQHGGGDNISMIEIKVVE